MTDPMIQELAAMLRRRDSPPDQVRRSALRVPDIVDELVLPSSSVLFDRRVPTAGPAVRDESPESILEFVGRGVTLTLRILRDGDLSEVIGLLDPPREMTIVCWHPAGRAATHSDVDGHFALRALPRGPLRVLVVTGVDSALDTDWLVG